jgi:hypothetical protein
LGVQGGNGRPLPACQVALANALGLPTEVSVPTGNPRWRAARIDIADTRLKVAIEIDGPSHQTRVQKDRDVRKEAMLRSLGWVVLRLDKTLVEKDICRAIASVRCLQDAVSSQSNG